MSQSLRTTVTMSSCLALLGSSEQFVQSSLLVTGFPTKQTKSRSAQDCTAESGADSWIVQQVTQVQHRSQSPCALKVLTFLGHGVEFSYLAGCSSV
eukprot:4603387-Amphidinium_carterae.1